MAAAQKTYGWGFMLMRFCDQGRTAHRLRGDGSPACGARYYASCGASTEVSEGQKCRRCRRLKTV